MLTLFAIPKHFHGELETIQRNAITSWTFLRPRPEIMLFGGEEGTGELARELGLLYVPDIARNEYGTPLLNDLFEKAQKLAHNNLVGYLNADIILLGDLGKTLSLVAFSQFLLTGWRLDLECGKPLDFGSECWENTLRDRAKKEGKCHGHTAVDYFIFPRGLYRSLPPFALGRTMWDNWLIYRARSLGVPVIDATRMITAIHQNHGYQHHPESSTGVWKGPEAERNIALAGGLKYEFTLKDVNLILTPEGLKKPTLTRNLLYRKFETLPALHPRLSFLAVIARGILQVHFKLRDISQRLRRIWNPAFRKKEIR